MAANQNGAVEEELRLTATPGLGPILQILERNCLLGERIGDELPRSTKGVGHQNQVEFGLPGAQPFAYAVLERLVFAIRAEHEGVEPAADAQIIGQAFDGAPQD